MPQSGRFHAFKPYSTVLFLVYSSWVVLMISLLEFDKLSLGKKGCFCCFWNMQRVWNVDKTGIENFPYFATARKPLWGHMTFAEYLEIILWWFIFFQNHGYEFIALGSDKFDPFAIQDYEGRLGGNRLQFHVSSFQGQDASIFWCKSFPLHKPQMLSISHLHGALREKIPHCSHYRDPRRR